MSDLDKLALATLCDMVLGLDAKDRSDDALIRRVRLYLNAFLEAKQLFHEIVRDKRNLAYEAEYWLRAYKEL